MIKLCGYAPVLRLCRVWSRMKSSMISTAEGQCWRMTGCGERLEGLGEIGCRELLCFRQRDQI